MSSADPERVGTEGAELLSHADYMGGMSVRGGRQQNHGRQKHIALLFLAIGWGKLAAACARRAHTGRCSAACRMSDMDVLSLHEAYRFSEGHRTHMQTASEPPQTHDLELSS